MNYLAKNSKHTKFGLIDREDICLIEGKNVNICSDGYARIGSVRLHRLVMERILSRPIKKGFVVDHINRNRLDNRRENLREVTVLKNNLNKDLSKSSRKCYGSTFLKKRNKWQAQIKINNKQTYLGVFDTEEQAQACYLEKARELGMI